LTEVALVPPDVVTLTSTVPDPAGEVALICVALLKLNVVAAVPPKLTAVTPVKFVPVIVTLVPPVVRPVFGLTLVTVGAGVGVGVAEGVGVGAVYVN
jgi:hypothetical protein